jgi:CheY-like chemotaxis protein
MSNVVALIPDLIFRTKVSGTGAALGIPVACAATAGEVATLVQADPPRLILVDLNAPPGEVTAAIQAGRAAGCRRIVAFYAHIETELAEAARQSGATDVMPRSAFNARLPELLADAGA